MKSFRDMTAAVKVQARERGWLLTVIALWCGLMGVTCMVVGGVVCILALVHGSVPIQQPAAMFSVGMLTIAATYSMWKYERWGRNVAVVVTVSMGWVMAEALQRKFGVGSGIKISVVIFGAVAVSYFSSPNGRFLFRKKTEEEEGAGNELVG
ncbi:MAG: hypothetical protein E6R08_00700 [Nevskiaceae bacterium]|nr:MAG: hypothetical protein E6R08_00700 [Nevskiaceae bacterium]